MAGRFKFFRARVERTPRLLPVRVRSDVTSSEREAVTAALDAVPWSRLEHAYGPAADVPALLYAIAVGDADSRKAAWSELWGNIHHQGTVYQATVDAVPFIGAVAAKREHPDRVQAICFLREIAVGSGQYAPVVRASVWPVAEALLREVSTEPELARRALLWLLSAFPSHVEEHADLLSLVPSPVRPTWVEILERVRTRGEDRECDEADDAAFDRQDEFERWALAGWMEPEAGDS